MSPRNYDYRPEYSGGGYGGGGYRRGPTVLDLMLRRGDAEAEHAYQGADIWSNAIQQLTGVAGDYFKRRDDEKVSKALRTAQAPYPEATHSRGAMPGDPQDQGIDHMDSILQTVPEDRRAEVTEKLKPVVEARQMAKRDAAWVGLIESGDLFKDPKAGYAKTLRIWGPDKAPGQWQAALGVMQLAGDKRNPEADRKALGDVIGAMGMVEGPARARLYPQAVSLAKKVYPDYQVSPEYNEEQWPEIDALGKQMRGEKPEKSGKNVLTVPAPGGGPMSKSFTDDEVAAGVPTYREPKVAARPNLERVETTDENGKTVTRFVVPKEGDAFAKPTGAAKPATGAQKKALNFFNRAKEAMEAAEAVEGDMAKLGPIDETRLGYGGPGAGYVQSDQMQSYNQAQRAFTEARLRKESGAAVPQSEYDNDRKTYWKVQGDSEAAVAQKARMRKAVLAGIAFETGDALREYYGDEAEGMLSSLKEASRGASAPVPSGQAKRVTKAEYDKLPAGASYIDPNGNIRTKH